MNTGAFNKAKTAIHASLMHTCDIYGFKKIGDGSVTKNERELKYRGAKCQLTQKSLRPSEGAGAASEYRTDAKLIICGDVTIVPGDEFDVFTGMETKKHKCASDPFVYSTHQEVAVVRLGRA